MKTLWLLRHAKSSWNAPALPDHERPLKPRGERAAIRMGQLLAAQAPFPDAVVCSTAVRARETWRHVERAFADRRAVSPVEFRADLYHADVEQLRSIVASIPEAHSAVLLIGHNPGLENFAESLTGTTVTIPTATLLCIELESPHWRDFATAKTATVKHIWRPRELD